MDERFTRDQTEAYGLYCYHLGERRQREAAAAAIRAASDALHRAACLGCAECAHERRN